MVQIPVAQALTGILNAPSALGPQSGVVSRWEFTSTLRLTRQQQFNDRVNQQVAQLQGQTFSVPTPVATDFPLDSSMSVVTMAVNPKSVAFEQPKRWKKKDIRDGSVFFHFTNKKGQNNDILTISFRGNTGNIDLRGSIAEPLGGANDTGALNKLRVWHNLYQLTREPMLIGDHLENVFSITYTSALLPQPVEFRGFFNKVLDFEENADKPNSRDYSFQFTVTSTNPDLDELTRDILEVLETASTSNVRTTAELFGAGINSSGE